MGGATLVARYNPRSLKRIYLFDAAGKFLISAITERIPWDLDGTTDDVRRAIAHQRSNRKALKAAYVAETDMLDNPDPLVAVLQQRAGYAAGNQRLLTGTDDRPADPQPVIGNRPTLRIAGGGSHNDDGTTPFTPFTPPETAPDWFDRINLDSPPNENEDDQ